VEEHLVTPASRYTLKFSCLTFHNAIQLSFAFGQLRKYEEAAECFGRVLAIDPNNVLALNNKGFSLFGLGKHKEAIEYYDKALSIDPNNITTLNNKKAAINKLQM
jgi:tetratricopeptide (TPR) repeat protein